MRLVKIIILISIFLFIDFKIPSTSSLTAECSLATIKQAMPVRIFNEQTIDGPSQPIFLTRFLHNKIGIFLSEFGKCYFNILDPNYIDDRVGILGLFFISSALYRLAVSQKLKLLIALFLLIPFLSIFKLANFLEITTFLLWTFAALGAIILVKSHVQN